MFKELFIESSDLSEELMYAEKLMYAREIANKTGLNVKFLQSWMDDNNINYYKLLQAVGQKKIKPVDLVTAVSGNPGNSYAKKIKKLFKSVKTFKPKSSRSESKETFLLGFEKLT